MEQVIRLAKRYGLSQEEWQQKLTERIANIIVDMGTEVSQGGTEDA